MDIELNSKVIVNILAENLAYQQLVCDMFIKVVSKDINDENSKYAQLNDDLIQKKKAILEVLYENYGKVDFDGLLKK